MAPVVLDADVIIGLLSQDDAHHQAAKAALRTQLKEGNSLFISASVYAEILVHPIRAGTEKVVDTLIEQAQIEIVSLESKIARKAAKLRADYSELRLPDAFTVATAQHKNAAIISFDEAVGKVARKAGLALLR